MAHFFLLIPPPRKILIVAAAALACAAFQTPIASAQRVGHVGPVGHVGGGHFATGAHMATPRMGAPHGIAPRGPASRTDFLSPRAGFSGERLFPIFRRPFFFRAPFFWSWNSFYSPWWAYCGPVWGWEFGCGDWFLSNYTFEHYLAPPLTYNTTVYVYSQEWQPLVQLFLRDGTVYGVNDYWFLDGQVHFTMLDESGTKSVEQMIPIDDLDVQKTIDVNTRRGFRVVLRHEPIEQYLRDYPNLSPPLLKLPQKS
jgi:hypothetical protein